jgi:lysophospholipase L1-like esterase
MRRLAWITALAAIALFATMRCGSAQIVALGASATAGYGLPPSESFPSQLQAMLQARGSATRVINADGLIVAAARAGMLQRDGIHLTAAGNQRVAAGLVGSLR